MKGYAIVCSARKGGAMGIETLALCDRKLTKKQWWTSDDSSLILCYRSHDAAKFACSRLHKNDPQVIDYKQAVDIINKQEDELIMC